MNTDKIVRLCWLIAGGSWMMIALVWWVISLQ